MFAFALERQPYPYFFKVLFIIFTSKIKTNPSLYDNET